MDRINRWFPYTRNGDCPRLYMVSPDIIQPPAVKKLDAVPGALPNSPVMRPEKAPLRQRPNSTRRSRTTRVCTIAMAAALIFGYQK